jgi:electron transfer flavoprotein beta subunit
MPDIVVCIKQSVDIEQLKFDPSTRAPILAGAPKKMGEMDRRAVEEALRIKTRMGGSVIALTIGGAETEDVMRRAYAMGVDEGYLVTGPELGSLDSSTKIKVLAAAIKKLPHFALVLCGAASSDVFSWQVGPGLAELLRVPVITSAKKLDIQGDEVTVECDLEKGTYTLKAKMPAVVTTTLDINEPRIPSLMAVLGASKKKAKMLTLEEIGMAQAKPLVQVSSISMPEVKRKKVIFDGSEAEKLGEATSRLIEALRKEGVME